MLEKIKNIGKDILELMGGIISIVIGWTLTIFIGMTVLGFITLCLGAL